MQGSLHVRQQRDGMVEVKEVDVENDEKSPGVPIWAAWVVTMVFGAFVAIIAWGITDSSWRSACVKRGVAKWTVVNDAGRTEFEWISK